MATTRRGQLKLTTNVTARDIFVYPNSTLELGPYNLDVSSTPEHTIGGGLVSNSGQGGEIVWLLPQGPTILMFE